MGVLHLLEHYEFEGLINNLIESWDSYNCKAASMNFLTL